MKLIFDWIKSKFYNSDFVRFENFQQRFALKKKKISMKYLHFLVLLLDLCLKVE